jgi:phage gp29-like protein
MPRPKKEVQFSDLVVEEPLLSQQIGLVSGPLTPAYVTSVLNTADLGRPSGLVDLGHDIRQKDGTIHAALKLAELMISQLSWRIVPPRDPKKKERKAAEAITEWLAGTERFAESIEHLSGEGPLFGFSDVEMLYARDGRFLIPVKAKPISCRRFIFRRRDGRLLFDPEGRSNESKGLDLLEQFAPGKFLQFTPRENGDVLVREGLARMLVWFGMGRNWTFKDWLMMAELAWKPKRLGKYKKGSLDTEDKTILKEILQRIMTTGIGIYPDSCEVSLLWPQGSSASGGKQEVHGTLLDWLGREIARAVLGADDILTSGENGARAATEVRAKNPTAFRNARARALADTITRQLIHPIVGMNFGDSIRPMRFEFSLSEPPDLEALSRSVKALREAAARIPEDWLSEQSGIPIPKPGERVIGGSEENPSEPTAPKEPSDATGQNGEEPGATEPTPETESEPED